MIVYNVNHQGNILTMKLEYSSEEEVKQILKKKKDNKDKTLKNSKKLSIS